MESADRPAKPKRVSVPPKTRESVLREFNHKCAICGKARPTIHHIDEDPSNNAPDNLLPLCPNHHYSDQHDPTAPIDPRKLKLFRRHKDPLILSPQFEPLFRRVTYLLELREPGFEVGATKAATLDLQRFVHELEMGRYYAAKIDELAAYKPEPRIRTLTEPDSEARRIEDQYRMRYFFQVEGAVAPILELLVELLRYQDWRWSPTDAIDHQ